MSAVRKFASDAAAHAGIVEARHPAPAAGRGAANALGGDR